MMPSSTITPDLTKLEDPSISQLERAKGYEELLARITSSADDLKVQNNLLEFLDSVLGVTLSIVTARTILGLYVEALAHIQNVAIRIECSQHALRSIEPRLASFEDQDAKIRELLADAYQESEDYAGAARALQGIQLDSPQRKMSDESKVEIWIRICRLYLEEDDTLSAESYLNRAKTLYHRVDNSELNLVFQLCQARILDSRRKFLEASQAYYTVSLAIALAEEERQATLSKAIICALLAPAGPARSRALGRLYKDERAGHVDEHSILEKMFLDRIVSPAEVVALSNKLAPHQLAQTADGSTVLAKAVIEHNLLGASRLYSNLGVGGLGTLLDLDAEIAEQYAARMLEQGRLAGHIDQIDGVIFFDHRSTASSGAKAPPGLPTLNGLRQWDGHVQGLVEDVERVSSLLQETTQARG
jgi:COP9 signalosome complex subunit 4